MANDQRKTDKMQYYGKEKPHFALNQYDTHSSLRKSHVACVYSGVSGVMGVAQVRRGTPGNYIRAQGSTAGL